MLANTRKMHEIQSIIESILEEEIILCDIFNSLVEEGKMTEAELKVLVSTGKSQNLHTSEIVYLTREEIMENPYLKNIDVPNITMNNLRLAKKRIIRPEIITKLGVKRRNLKTMRQVNSYFICDKSLRFPGLVEGNQTIPLMTVEPFEINSFESFIESATGNVLLVGCGLGYVAYMLSRKKDVTSITIVDKSQDVLDLFNEHILPQFEKKDKIRTIAMDGIDYLRTADLSIYNHVNVDIWYDTIDMIYTYLSCLEIEKENPTVQFSYWLEEELKFDIQNGILLATTRPDCVEGKQNIPPNNLALHNPKTTFLTDIIGKDLIMETPISNYEDLYNLVDIKDLRTILLGWYANNLEKVESQKEKDMQKISQIHRRSQVPKLNLVPNQPKVFFK